MAEILKGAPVAEKLNGETAAKVAALVAAGVTPTLAIVRCGENPSDMAYERGAVKRAEALGIAVKKYLLPEDIEKDKLKAVISEINEDKAIHGVLLLRPLPVHLREFDDEICNVLIPEKDMDGITHGSMAGVYSGKPLGYPPCTPRACMEILDFYNIPCLGTDACVVGNGIVAGRPTTMMLLEREATVAATHIRTKDTASYARRAELLISAAGCRNLITKDFVNENSIVIDVGINAKPEGGICGDVNFEEVEPIVKAITPVPGGVGSVTTAVLMSNVVDAAEKQSKK